MSTVELNTQQAYWTWCVAHDLLNTMLPGDIHIIGGATGTGKSTFVRNLLKGFVAQGLKPFVESTEMGKKDYIIATVAMEAGLPCDRVRRKQWHLLPKDAEDRCKKAQQIVMREFIDGTTFGKERSPSAYSVLAHMKMAAEAGSKIYILDTLQQVNVAEFGHGPKNERLENLLSQIHELAGMLGMIVIVVCQFNRDDRQNTLKYSKPQLNWLQGSSKIEQIAASVTALSKKIKHFEEKEFLQLCREIKNQQKNEEELYEPNMVRLYCLKHRDKGTATGQYYELFHHEGRLVETGYTKTVQDYPGIELPVPWPVAKEQDPWGDIEPQDEPEEALVPPPRNTKPEQIVLTGMANLQDQAIL